MCHFFNILVWNVKNHIPSEDFEGWKIFCDHSTHKHCPLPHKICLYKWIWQKINKLEVWHGFLWLHGIVGWICHFIEDSILMGPVKGAVDMIFGLYSSIDSQVNIICNNPMLGNAKILLLFPISGGEGWPRRKKKSFVVIKLFHYGEIYY